MDRFLEMVILQLFQEELSSGEATFYQIYVILCLNLIIRGAKLAAHTT